MAAAEKHVDIALEYQREGQLSSGQVAVYAGGHLSHAEKFDRAEFPRLLTHLARLIAQHPSARVVLLRTDVPNLFPYVLDKETTELFRVDPVAAIHSMVFEPEVNVAKKEDPRPVEIRPLRVGYETLADSFGEHVYVRVRSNSIECPGCGLWGEMAEGHFTCARRCSGAISFPIEPSRFWAGISVEHLLGTNLTKFFLPRIWNDGRSWVTREDLQSKYTAYRAEKDEACSRV